MFSTESLRIALRRSMPIDTAADANESILRILQGQSFRRFLQFVLADANAANGKPMRLVDFRRVVFPYATRSLCKRQNPAAQMSSTGPSGQLHHRFCRRWPASL